MACQKLNTVAWHLRENSDVERRPLVATPTLSRPDPAQLREPTRPSISGSNLPTGFRRFPFPSHQPWPRPYRFFDTVT